MWRSLIVLKRAGLQDPLGWLRNIQAPHVQRLWAERPPLSPDPENSGGWMASGGLLESCQVVVGGAGEGCGGICLP